MNRPNLAELLRESALKVEEERDFNNHVARVAAIAKPEIEKLLAQHKSETSNAPSAYKLTCAQCGAVHRISAEDLEPWETDEETSSTDGDLDGNPDEDGDDDKIDELDAKGKSRVVAQLLANKRRR